MIISGSFENNIGCRNGNRVAKNSEMLSLILPTYLVQPDYLIAQTTLVHELQQQMKPTNKVLINGRLSEREVEHFSPTVTLSSEVFFGISDVLGKDIDESAVFSGSVETILNTSFTGEDTLEVGIESGNLVEFSFIDEITNEGRLGFLTNTDNNHFKLSELSYEFPVSDRASFYLSTTGNDINDFNPFLEDSSNGNSNAAISEFGTENPIHNLVPDVGFQLNYDLTKTLSMSLGYFSEEANNPESGKGLFNGNQSKFVQLQFEPNDRFLLGLTYIHTYNDSSLETGTGSLRSQVNLERPVVGNSYGMGASWFLNPQMAIGGWVGFTNGTVIDLGDAYIWNYALTLNFPDLGKEGNLLGFVIGQEPKLTGTRGFTIDERRQDPDTSFHLEAFYRNQLNNYLSITPGIIWITAPSHDKDNADLVLFTIRTTFKF